MDGNPGRGEHALALLWLLGAAVVLSNAAGGALATVAMASFALFLSITWGLRLFIALKRRSHILLEHWLVWPGAFVLAVGLHITQAPRLLRLKLSEDALLEAIELRRPGGAGLFDVLEVIPKEDGTYLVTKDGIFGAAGFAYFPDDVPTNKKLKMRHVSGHWWTFRSRPD